ncbi:Group II intron-encoded protein LtrA [Anaerolineae bacterium]|nr:Group II intron-encoded protein LtrA [Anaerolineae bacterium]
MRKAETVLNVISDRSKRGLLLDEDVYRQLYNPDLYLRAYSRLYKNEGVLTEGVTSETADGMSLEKIHSLIEQLRYERWRWTAVRRTTIPKKNGKRRPLGIPTWSDKILQEVIRSILEAYYEPRFSDLSHGFRPGRGCHTALQTIQRTWLGTTWFIEGDVHACFDSIDHDILLSILCESIRDNRFLRLIEQLLKAGYMDASAWNIHPTLSGTPQGGIVSPILSNIYLDQLDQFVEKTLLPEYTRGEMREENPEFSRLFKKAWHLKKTGRYDEAHELEKQYQQMPSKVVDDPNYRRLRYIRYADDFLLGFAGPLTEAREIKEKLREFLRDHLKLELSEEKTLITHARTEVAKFLGYELATQQADSKHTDGKRSVNGVIALRVPAAFVEEKCADYMANQKPVHRPELESEEDFTIVYHYQSRYRGYVQFYKLAINLAWLSRLKWVMETSLLKTLAHKHKTRVSRIVRQYKKKLKLPGGIRKCIAVTITREGKEPLKTYFGGIPLIRNPKATIVDLSTTNRKPTRSDLVKRLLADVCEICGATGNIEVHHIHALKDLKVKGQREKPLWMQIMAARRRKTLMVCKSCHDKIQYGKPTRLQRH